VIGGLGSSYKDWDRMSVEIVARHFDFAERHPNADLLQLASISINTLSSRLI
jgi:hypothetical protein